jgi:signal transduction histidine kinase
VAESRSNELAALLTISQDVSSIFELEPLLNRIIYHLGEVIEFSSLLLLELTGEELSVLAQYGIVPAPLAVDDEFSSAWLQEDTLLFTSHEPIIWADLAKDLNAREGMCRTFGKKLELLLQETRSCMIVPMVSRDMIAGIFWIGHKQPGYFSELQADYIMAVAHQAAIAIENAHQLEAMQVAAADRERNRLAQELHDSVSQSLLAASKAAESLPIIWERSPEQGKYVLGLLQRMMQNALAEMRTLMLELRPAMLGQKPLGEILHQLSDSFAGRSQLPVDLQINGDALLPAICQVTFYRIAQGVFDNIHQHANASHVTVALNCTPQFVELWIADDGEGFDLAKVPPDRMGLNIMRERAGKIGATFQLESQPRHGTQITVHYDRPNR